MAQKKQGRVDVRRQSDRPLRAIDKKPSVRMLPAMPLLITYHPNTVSISCEQWAEELVFGIHQGPKAWPYIDNVIDAHQLRETFLEIRTPGEALQWFAVAGNFRYCYRTYEDYGIDYETITWHDLQLWQEFIRLRMSNGYIRVKHEGENGENLKFVVPEHMNQLFDDLSSLEESALVGVPDGLHIQKGSLFGDRTLEWHLKPIVAEFDVTSALDAILATIYVDELRGINYQLCALTDCSNLYVVRSKHVRLYCSQLCAHKASVRRRRAVAKSTEQGTKSKKVLVNERKSKG